MSLITFNSLVYSGTPPLFLLLIRRKSCMGGPFSALHGKPGVLAGCLSHTVRHAQRRREWCAVVLVTTLWRPEAHPQAPVRELLKCQREAGSWPSHQPFHALPPVKYLDQSRGIGPATLLSL